MTKYIYQISQMIPSAEENLDRWKFNIELDSKVAIEFRRRKIGYAREKRFQQDGLMIIERYGLKGFESPRPYRFIEDSWLLHFAIVPGGDCTLSLGNFCLDNFFGENWKDIKDDSEFEPIFLTYNSHNVDTKDQAFCLLSLWTHWANAVNVLFNTACQGRDLNGRR